MSVPVSVRRFGWRNLIEITSADEAKNELKIKQRFRFDAKCTCQA